MEFQSHKYTDCDHQHNFPLTSSHIFSRFIVHHRTMIRLHLMTNAAVIHRNKKTDFSNSHKSPSPCYIFVNIHSTIFTYPFTHLKVSTLSSSHRNFLLPLPASLSLHQHLRCSPSISMSASAEKSLKY